MSLSNNNKGFTLIEVIVVAAIIAILAGILVPMIFNQIDESKTSRAQADVRVLANAIMMFRSDTGKWPTWDTSTGTDAVTLLYVPDATAGTTPTLSAGWGGVVAGNITDHIRDNTNAYYKNWKGPYIPQLNVDPWGHALVINAGAFRSPGSPVWVISAGPNGVVDTPEDSPTINKTKIGVDISGADDIGVRLQ
jgi:general secretion pathway protein G